jgi:hypothetical protein
VIDDREIFGPTDTKDATYADPAIAAIWGWLWFCNLLLLIICNPNVL